MHSSNDNKSHLMHLVAMYMKGLNSLRKCYFNLRHITRKWTKNSGTHLGSYNVDFTKTIKIPAAHSQNVETYKVSYWRESRSNFSNLFTWLSQTCYFLKKQDRRLGNSIFLKSKYISWIWTLVWKTAHNSSWLILFVKEKQLITALGSFYLSKKNSS